MFTRGVGASNATQTSSPSLRQPVLVASGPVLYYHSPRTRVGLYKIAAVGGEPQIVEENAVSAAISPTAPRWRFSEESDQGGRLTSAGVANRKPRRECEQPPQARKIFFGSDSTFSPKTDASGVLVPAVCRPYRCRFPFFEISMTDRLVQCSITPQTLTPQTFGWFPDTHIVMMQKTGDGHHGCCLP